MDSFIANATAHLKLIDFSPFFNGSKEDKLAVGKGLVDGFKDAGFVYIKNHDISQETIQKVFSESAKFFSCPKDQKDAVAWTTPQSNRGYLSSTRWRPTVAELNSNSPELQESFEIGRDDVPGNPNRWPDVFDGTGKEFKATMKNFFEKCKDLNIVIMRAIALGMGLEENFFDKFFDGGNHNLRLLHYPAQSKEVFKKDQSQVLRLLEHSDFGSVTLLFQDDRGGLQVRSPGGTFVDATPIPGTIVINAGDLLARWSNNTIRSTEHRVVEPPICITPESDVHPARYSCAYFCNPNFDAYIEALPGTYESEEKRIYPGINCGDYMVERLASYYE
ncbi:hypothetical protein RUND412_002794 [Rhizina undulata]